MAKKRGVPKAALYYMRQAELDPEYMAGVRRRFEAAAKRKQATPAARLTKAERAAKFSGIMQQIVSREKKAAATPAGHFTKGSSGAGEIQVRAHTKYRKGKAVFVPAHTRVLKSSGKTGGRAPGSSFRPATRGNFLPSWD